MPIAAVARPGYDGLVHGFGHELAAALRPAREPEQQLDKLGDHRRSCICAFAPIHGRPPYLRQGNPFGTANMMARPRDPLTHRLIPV